MSVTPSSAIVGVFREQAVAEQAVDAFFNAGFTNEQVLRSTPESSGGFFEDLKNLFTGSSGGSSDVASDLTNMGLSQDNAQYYAQEHRDGNTIVAVHAPGREQEAQAIMHQYGAYSAQARSDDAPQNTTSTTQTSDTDTTPVSNDTSPTQDQGTHQEPVEAQSYQQDVQHSPNFILVPNSDQPEQTSQTHTEQAGSDPYHQEATQTYDTASNTAQMPDSAEDTGKYATYSDSIDSTHTEQNAQPLPADDAGSEPPTDVSNQAFQPEVSTYSTAADTDQPITTDTSDNEPSHEAPPSYYSDQQTPSIAQDTEPQDTSSTNVHTSSSVANDNTSSTEPQTSYVTDTYDTTPDVSQTTTAEAQTVDQTTTAQPDTTDQTATTEPQTAAQTTTEAQTPYVTDLHNETPVVDQPSITEPDATPPTTDGPTHTVTTAQSLGDVSNADTEPLVVHTGSTDSSVTDNQNGQNAAPVTTADVAEPQTEPAPVTTATTDGTVTPEAAATSVMTPEPSPASSTADTDDLEELQKQYTAMQQQLQDVQAQLQAAREQEEHLKTTQARRQQIESLRQQMQALQAELAAAHAELQDTHARISQYQ